MHSKGTVMKCFQVWYKNLSLPLYLGFFFSCSILQTWISTSLSHSSLINHSLIHPKKKKKNYRFNSTISSIICWASIQGTKNLLFLHPYNFLTNQANQLDILFFFFGILCHCYSKIQSKAVIETFSLHPNRFKNI